MGVLDGTDGGRRARHGLPRGPGVADGPGVDHGEDRGLRLGPGRTLDWWWGRRSTKEKQRRGF